jgi:bifunctional DNase/RNase
VTRIEEGTFYGEISLVTPAGSLVLDARPSDSVALAVRTEAPLFVAEDVLDEAGIPAEMVEPHTEDEEALDEFKKFLDDVDPEDFQG